MKEDSLNGKTLVSKTKDDGSIPSRPAKDTISVKPRKEIPPQLIKNIGRFKDNQPSSESLKEGWVKWRARKELKNDVFKALVGLGTMDKGITTIDGCINSDKLTEEKKAYLFTKILEFVATPDRQETEHSGVINIMTDKQDENL